MYYPFNTKQVPDPGVTMKTTIAILSLILSVNIYASDIAYSSADSTVLTSAGPMLSSVTTSGSLPEKQAQMVLNDAQELIQDGKMTAFLNQKIKDIQALNADTSESEALDMLIEQAENILN